MRRAASVSPCRSKYAVPVGPAGREGFKTLVGVGGKRR